MTSVAIEDSTSAAPPPLRSYEEDPTGPERDEDRQRDPESYGYDFELAAPRAKFAIAKRVSGSADIDIETRSIESTTVMWPLVDESTSGAPVGTPTVTQGAGPRQGAPITVENRVEALITSRVEPIMEALYQFINNTALEHYVQVSRIEVSAFINPEEDDRQIVVTQYVRARPEFALNYWDDFGAAMNAWLETLPDEYREIANERIAVIVESDPA